MSARLALVLLLCLSLLSPTSTHALAATADKVAVKERVAPARAGGDAAAADRVAERAAARAPAAYHDCHGKRGAAVSQPQPAEAGVDLEPGASDPHACCDEGGCHCAVSAFIPGMTQVAAGEPAARLLAFATGTGPAGAIERPLRPPIG
jgi:hypothetical protein